MPRSWRRHLRVPWTARRSNQSYGKSALNTHWKDWCWSWCSSILVTWCKQPTHWESPWCWERLRAEGEEGAVRGWDGWTASPKQWTWTWANFGRWWGTERPSVLQSMWSLGVRHDWATELQQLPSTLCRQGDRSTVMTAEKISLCFSFLLTQIKRSEFRKAGREHIPSTTSSLLVLEFYFYAINYHKFISLNQHPFTHSQFGSS